VGASCSIQTSADAVAPGAVVEKRRAIWALSQVRVLGGGPDGEADTVAGNELFQVQGVLVP
jgi:hypothetical protein